MVRAHLHCAKVGGCIGAVQRVCTVVAHHTALPAAPVNLRTAQRCLLKIEIQGMSGYQTQKQYSSQDMLKQLAVLTFHSSPQGVAPDVLASAPLRALSSDSLSSCAAVPDGSSVPTEMSLCMHSGTLSPTHICMYTNDTKEPAQLL